MWIWRKGGLTDVTTIHKRGTHDGFGEDKAQSGVDEFWSDTFEDDKWNCFLETPGEPQTISHTYSPMAFSTSSKNFVLLWWLILFFFGFVSQLSENNRNGNSKSTFVWIDIIYIMNNSLNVISSNYLILTKDSHKLIYRTPLTK